MKNLLNPLEYAKSFVYILPEDINIILHWRKSILYHNGDVWVKKASKDGFDIPQGSYVVTEVSKLMGLFGLSKIHKIIHNDNNELYRDDGLMIVTSKKKANDKISQLLFK